MISNFKSYCKTNPKFYIWCFMFFFFSRIEMPFIQVIRFLNDITFFRSHHKRVYVNKINDTKPLKSVYVSYVSWCLCGRISGGRKIGLQVPRVYSHIHKLWYIYLGLTTYKERGRETWNRYKSYIGIFLWSYLFLGLLFYYSKKDSTLGHRPKCFWGENVLKVFKGLMKMISFSFNTESQSEMKSFFSVCSCSFFFFLFSFISFNK